MAQWSQFEHRGKGLLVRAPSKLNLTLLISGKRADGFHELETIMAKIDLCDEIFIEHGSKTGIELICQGDEEVPGGKENLVWQAAKKSLRKAGRQGNVRISLTKNIPPGSGLGSGSSDAAATLIGLNRFLDLALCDEDLYELACELGSDVPFFLNSPIAFCSGRGEKIAPLEQNFPFSALVILPDITVSTKEVYENYEHDANLYQHLHSRMRPLVEKNRVDLAARICPNMLQDSCFKVQQNLRKLKASIESLGCKPLCLSGSGSAMFHVAGQKDEKKLSRIQYDLEKKIGCRCVVVRNNRW